MGSKISYMERTTNQLIFQQNIGRIIFNMKYIIWGAGYRGKVLIHILGQSCIEAFIDLNEEKIGQTYYGKPIISYQQYKESYKNFVIIVSISFEERVIKKLEADGVFCFGIEECPPEYMGYGWHCASKYMQRAQLDFLGDAKKVAIYGCTLFSILVYNKLKTLNNCSIIMIPHKNISKSKIEQFKSYYPEINLKSLKDANDCDIMLITVNHNRMITFDIHVKTINIYDWTKYIKEYTNPKIKAMQNQHYGERCFIVATGPSLRYSDLETLKNHNEFCISMNSIFSCFDKTDWRPNQYVVVDVTVLEKWGNIILSLDIEDIFIPDAGMFFDYSCLKTNCYIYHSIFSREVYENGFFSDDFSCYAYNWGMITGICIQLAVFLGFKDIYLLGVDFSYIPKKINHFNENQANKNTYYDEENEMDILFKYALTGYQNAKLHAEKHGVHIYNASRGGNLNVFDRVDFSELFKNNE